MSVVPLLSQSPTTGVVGVDFLNCQLIGPALVAFGPGTILTGSTFEGTPGTMLWEIAPDRPGIQGAVVFQYSTFESCVFGRVGIAGSKEELSSFRTMPTAESIGRE